MNTFKIVLTTLVVGVLVAGATGAGIIYSGVYNVGADDHHLDVTHWMLNQARKRSVVAHAASIETPPLGSRQQLLIGAANFQEMCVSCHMPPGGQMTVAAQGMYPQPSNLMESGEEMPAKQIFWTLEHGIKASGMPAWGTTHGADELWALTALVKQFPKMSGADYQKLVRVAETRGIGHGDEGHGQSHSNEDHGSHEHGHDDGHAPPATGSKEQEPHSHDAEHAHT